MSKLKIENFAHIDDAILTRVARVLADRKARRYSVSAVYGAHNAVFKLKETPQTCDSCLVTRVNALSKFNDWYAKEVAPKVETSAEETLVPDAGQTSTVSTEPLSEVERALQDDQLNAQHQALQDFTSTNDAQDFIDGKIAITLGAPDSMPVAEATTELPHDGLSALTEGAQRIILQRIDKDTYVAEGDALYGDFTVSADDVTKGTIINTATGKALAAGTYATEDPKKILSVSVGGKAYYKQLD